MFTRLRRYGFEFKAFNRYIFPANGQCETNHCNFVFLVGEDSNFIQFFSCLGATCASGPAVPRKCFFSRANCHRARCDAAPHPKVNQSFGFNSRAVTAPAPSRSNAWTRAHALCLTCPSICGYPPHRFHPTKSNHSLWVKGRTPPLERKRLKTPSVFGGITCLLWQYFAKDLCLNVPSPCLNLIWDPTFKTSGNEPLGLQPPPQDGGCLSLALDLKAARLKHRHSSSARRAAGALTWAHSSSRAFLQSPWGTSGGLEQSCVGFSNLQLPWTRSTAHRDGWSYDRYMLMPASLWGLSSLRLETA